MLDSSNDLLETVKQAAYEAGTLLREGYSQKGRIAFEQKGTSDFVSYYDTAAENIIIDCISSAFPDIAFLGEESGLTPTDSDYTVIIDPLDGTSNFLHGVPHFSVSIAVTKGEELIIGVVYQPLLDEMLWAGQGIGAFLNDKPLTTPDARPLTEMLVSTCLPYHAKGDCTTTINQLAVLMPQVAGIRSPGSAALEIAYLSLGRFDAFWSQGAALEFWDIAAGIVIAREAGYTVTDLAGKQSPGQWSSILAAHPERYGQLLGCLKAC
ncbi:inositol monophosphatase family protein [Vreelandella boliviensis]|uniref:Inositol-1-monophosphatase n=1 Tax=Vreelandella boliviensis LC1 TaxID=1072583 RepID=A0A265E3C5_9GAMM|nr:inositol monophosphatase family protein [Halomonas boliviensis]EHJ93440.1 Inositol-1-monophosphatase [Halomonas boliviensis LC1]OZT76030.1 inositol monophosphatase [Halomonas boliviensis LC1]